jgi:hypothetical protein
MTYPLQDGWNGDIKAVVLHLKLSISTLPINAALVAVSSIWHQKKPLLYYSSNNNQQTIGIVPHLAY